MAAVYPDSGISYFLRLGITFTGVSIGAAIGGVTAVYLGTSGSEFCSDQINTATGLIDPSFPFASILSTITSVGTATTCVFECGIAGAVIGGTAGSIVADKIARFILSPHPHIN